MSAMVSQITSTSIVCSTVCLVVDQIKHQSSASPAFVKGDPPVTSGSPWLRAINATTSFHFMTSSWIPPASSAVRLRIADCLPGDYNMPISRNSFKFLGWSVGSLAYMTLVSRGHRPPVFSKIQLSVPSMRMFSDFKLSLSNVSVGHWRCVYSSFLLQSCWTVEIGHHHFICQVSAQSLLGIKILRACKIFSKPNIAEPLDNSNSIESIA